MTEAIAKQVLVPFAGTQIMVIDNGADRPVPMKELIEGIKTNDGSKLEWEPMRKLIARDKVLRSVASIMEVTAKDGKNYQSLTLPMNYLPGFFFKITLSRYKGEIAQMLENYQRNCYNVLYQYFSTGCVINLETIKKWLSSLSITERFRFFRLLYDFIGETFLPKEIDAPEECKETVRPYERIKRGMKKLLGAGKPSTTYKDRAIAELSKDRGFSPLVGRSLYDAAHNIGNVGFVDNDILLRLGKYLTPDTVPALLAIGVGFEPRNEYGEELDPEMVFGKWLRGGDITPQERISAKVWACDTILKYANDFAEDVASLAKDYKAHEEY